MCFYVDIYNVKWIEFTGNLKWAQRKSQIEKVYNMKRKVLGNLGVEREGC